MNFYDTRENRLTVMTNRWRQVYTRVNFGDKRRRKQNIIKKKMREKNNKRKREGGQRNRKENIKGKRNRGRNVFDASVN